MTPWTIIGWALIAWFSFWAIFLAAKVGAIFFDIWRTQRRFKRANKGKVSCEHCPTEGTVLGCNNVAAWQTPNGFFCDFHRMPNVSKTIFTGSVSYSRPLEWTKDSK